MTPGQLSSTSIATPNRRLAWTVSALATAAATALPALQGEPTPNNLLSPTAVDFYAPNSVQEIRLTITPERQRRMIEALPDRVYVPATLKWQDTVIENVGVRFKGNSSSHPHQRHKRSYLIKVNEFEKGTRFHRLRRIALDNGVQFGGLYSEVLITEILQHLGLPASRSNYATLFVNDSYQGLYVNVERLDESFLEWRFGTPVGPLFKGEGGPGVNWQAIPGDADAIHYRKGFEAKTDAAESEAGLQALAEFIRRVSNPPSAEAESLIEQTLVLDNFLKTTAVMLFAGAFDQLTGWNPHNYYVYRNPGTDRWHYLPWDLDVGFADRAFGKIPVLEGWHAAWPVPGGPPRPIFDTIVESPSLLTRYRQHATSILETYFHPDRLHPRIDALAALIAPHLDNDPYPTTRVTNPSDASHKDVVDSIKAFITQRYELANRQLREPGPRPELLPNPQPQHDPSAHPGPDPAHEPRPGTMPGMPTDLRIVSRGEDAIHLTWKDQADGEVAHIVQRSEQTPDGQWTPFRNHIGRPGNNRTQAHDPDIRPNTHYRYRVYALFATPQGLAGSPPSSPIERD